MNTTRDIRGRCELHTLQSLQADHHHFHIEGKGDLKQAKLFNNVVWPIFFSIPITQVCTKEYKYTKKFNHNYINACRYNYEPTGKFSRSAHNSGDVLLAMVLVEREMPST